MTVTGPASPLCLFQSKVEDALSLVPNMGAEEKLKAVQFWNIISEKLQEIVNNSAADINALALKFNENKKIPLQLDSGTVAQENMYANDYVSEASSFVVCAEPNTQCITENLATQNGHYIPPNGTPFTTVCFTDASAHQNCAITYSSPVRTSSEEPIAYVKNPSSDKCSQSSSINHINDGLIDFSLSAGSAVASSGITNSNDSGCSVSTAHTAAGNLKNRRAKQKSVHKQIKHKKNASQLHVSAPVSGPETVLKEFGVEGSIAEVTEDLNIDTSLESACSSLSDVFDSQKKSGFTTVDEKFKNVQWRKTATGKKILLEEEGTCTNTGENISKSCSYVCDWCEQEFSDSLSLDTHRWTHTKPFVCTECDAQFSSKGNLMVHFRRHTGEKPYNCATCPARFSTRGNLRRHMKVHTGVKPYECMQCGSRFTEKKSLKVHMRRHTGEKPYGCKICGKCFSQSGILQAHMAVHLNERAHLCEHCGKAFRQKSQLRVHKLRHQGVRNYTCSACPARFLTKGDLERHTRVHTGERPFICDLCKKTFTRQQSLKEHLNRHYGLKPFRCKHCGKSFAEMSACYKHVKQHEKLPKDSGDEKTGQEENYVQDADSPSTIRISSAESLSHIPLNSNSKLEVQGQKYAVIFQDGQDIEVHSEFTVQSESAIGTSVGEPNQTS